MSGKMLRQTALHFVILLGIVSLFADITYEGARSITGPYLAVLGANATIVGFVAGFGEFIGYALRLVSGYLADKTSRYWLLTILGYIINLLAVPCLALTNFWPAAASLIVIERLGKAIRTPARDAMLSFAAHELGTGWGFGLHQALDQVGAVLGPLIIAWVLFFKGSYHSAFAFLLIPALLALAVLFFSYWLYPKPQHLEVKHDQLKIEKFNLTFWYYVAAASAIAMGYADFPLIAYHFAKDSIFSKDMIAITYATAMGIDAISALVFGLIYDRIGPLILILTTIISAFFAPMVFLSNKFSALLGMCLWGLGMGAQTSIMKAFIADLVPPQQRGTAYGWFNMSYGVFWFLGSASMGLIYDISIIWVVIFSMLMQFIALPFLYIVVKRYRHV